MPNRFSHLKNRNVVIIAGGKDAGGLSSVQYHGTGAKDYPYMNMLPRTYQFSVTVDQHITILDLNYAWMVIVCLENISKEYVTFTRDDYISFIKSMLSTIGDGRISVSPYDTAWIALIKDIHRQDSPQFASSLDWVARNQLPDGSWGDKHFFCASDRLMNTLACVVALRSWNVHLDKSRKGISFIREHLHQLRNVKPEHMNCGFEVAFPALLQRAKNLGIDLPYDDSVIRAIYAARNEKLKRIPKELMHQVRTTLLYSLEGLEDLDWHKLRKLQSKDGSFLTSPSSTAFAFIETKNDRCLKFIDNIIQKFNGGAPHTYPVDIFSRLWAVDRLQRLGISRYFESEIDDCLSHVHRFWTEEGVFSGRDSAFSDIDDTSMGFRLLRLHGYDLNPNVFRKFKSEDTFTCFCGEMVDSASPIFNLYRASQLQFPGEEILDEARDFSYSFLQQKLASNQLVDKWVVSKNLANEIQHGLEMPWYSFLPRVETRFYLDHYGGATDVWNGKAWYRMPDISNNAYLNLAILDFNECQRQHQVEWAYMQEWYDNFNIQEFGVDRNDLHLAYFLAAASIFEPERSIERTTWSKSQIISKMIASFFRRESTSLSQKDELVALFEGYFTGGTNSEDQGLVSALRELLESLDRQISHQLKNRWRIWLSKLRQGKVEDGELLATTLNICSGHILEEILSNYEYEILSRLINRICGALSKNRIYYTNVDEDMQELVQLVLSDESSSPGSMKKNMKQSFLQVAKAFYYVSYNDAEAIQMHMDKVLFNPII